MQLLSEAGWFQARGEIRRTVIVPHFYQSFLSLLLFLALLLCGSFRPRPWRLKSIPCCRPAGTRAATAAPSRTSSPWARTRRGFPRIGRGRSRGGASSATPAQPMPGQEAGSKGALPSAPAHGQPGEKHETLPAGKGETHAPGAEAGAHGEHGVKLPELSPIPGSPSWKRWFNCWIMNSTVAPWGGGPTTWSSAVSRIT